MTDDIQKQINNLGSSASEADDEFLKEEDDYTDEKRIIPDIFDSPDNLSVIKPAPKEKKEELEKKMKEIDIDEKEKQIKSRAVSLGLGYINLKGLPIMPEALRLISEDDSRKNGIICFMYRKNKEIRVAIMEDNEQVQKIIENLKERQKDIGLKIFLTSGLSMKEGLKAYASLPKIIEKKEEVEILESDLERTVTELGDLSDLKDKMKNISTTQVFSLILAAAIKMESSDIHIEAEESGIQLRFRIDGVLHNIVEMKKEIWEYLISRIKLSSKLKINIKDKPQDGHFSVDIKGEAVDFRVSTLPTVYGESVVMRILYHQKVKSMTFDNLGINDYNREVLDREIAKPNGMIVVTGPTGSGKTTTLYAVLNKLNLADNKIITIEDPIEYKIGGINQSEIREDKGYVFAKALRSVVRQDPDIILVGEIRDKETTEVVLNAALTGHLVFTTLHTNDAVGSISRFLSLGAKPYLLAPAMNVAIAQRLVRRLCDKCKQQIELNEENKQRIREEMESLPEQHKSKFSFDINNLKFYKSKGCDNCRGLGYKGQIGIFEIFEITDEIRDMILAEAVSGHKLNQLAQKNGMITMIQDGILKAVKGVTSLEEVFRVS